MPTVEQIIQTLTTTVHQAHTLQAPQAHTYALGQLAQAHSQIHQWPQAEQLSQQALMVAQQHKLPNAAYQWSWQLAHILQQQHRTEQALDAYDQALAHVNTVRQDLLIASAEQPFLLQAQAEPPNLVGQAWETQLGISQRSIQLDRESIEDLQLTELGDYFEHTCMDRAS